MTFNDYLIMVEDSLRSHDGFWNEAEAVMERPVRDVTHEYRGDEEHGT